jgi:plastocyanin
MEFGETSMRKGMWFAAAVILVAALGDPGRAADTQVKMVEGSSSDPNTWKFTPEEVTVPVGSTVTWRNEGSLEHDARTDSQEFSPLLGKGESHTFTFSMPGRYEYFCEPHRALGMTGVITVTGAPGTPTTATTTTTAAPGPGATTTTATAGGGATTTTRAGAGDGGSSTTTTTAGLGVTSTTQAASTTPTSAPETGDVTTTTEGHGGEEAAADDHGSEGGSNKKTNPVAVGLAGVLTAVLAAISIKLLTGP